jgi:hypothetical protein
LRSLLGWGVFETTFPGVVDDVRERAERELDQAGPLAKTAVRFLTRKRRRSRKKADGRSARRPAMSSRTLI